MSRSAAQALLLATGAIALSGMSEPPKGEITVSITNMRSSEGVVRACITKDRNAFPKCRKDPNALRAVVDAAESVTLTFADVEPGAYAIALLHDENNNGKADRALGMMPKEGFGFSRDARVRMGPPKFDEAVFDFDGTNAALTIRMRYML
jgi:uncharacterized protein (DUF2141 family)